MKNDHGVFSAPREVESARSLLPPLSLVSSLLQT
ncbi:uncharacterized protein HMPREF1541_03507 [Cyphellophora europaea CBS 101466]|uniref:Uncharacterized protein n=1 Tax=Cyphellophora europaea (strain CBS 101466) TaxID=1220924 RepID=W2RYJ1_CYPE1|nr:uncharacterized protein HMPREF1541_03507 [Cyphellophora europaea CBS 101466]ETN41571.1 hypothetical protein HMPREF1541_03507 [Cyphellophora europaea CBS 101466]